MNRATRDKFASGTKASLTSGNACWETPPAVFQKLQADFGPFDVDLTGDARRALVPVWFGPDSPAGEFDALSAFWALYGRTGYSNPPYGHFVKHLLDKAKLQARNDGFTSTLLLPLRVTRAFRRHVLDGASELFFCDRRITFYENGKPRINPRTGRADGALFDSIIVRYRPDHIGQPRVDEWHVPSHVPTKPRRQRTIAPPLFADRDERDELIAGEKR